MQQQQFPLEERSGGRICKERDLVFEFVTHTKNRPLKMLVEEHGKVAEEAVFKK